MNWIFLSILSAIMASLVAIFGKIGIKEIDSTLATTIRSIIMTIFLVGISYFYGKWEMLNQIDNKKLLFIIISGICGALSWIFYFSALKNGPTTSVATLDKMSIIFVALIAFLFLGETLTIKNIMGVLMITLGMIMMI